MKRLSSRLARIRCAGAVAALALVASAAPSWAVSASKDPAPPAGAPAHDSRARDSYDGPPLLLGDGKKFRIGGYGSFGGAYTRLMGRDSGLASFEGALLLDHRLSVGLVGYAFTRTPRGPTAADGTQQQFGAGYGGFAVRYSIFGGLPVYGTFGLVLGVGAVNLHRDDGWNDEASWDDGHHDDDRNWDAGRFDPFLFAQPEIALNANATRWLRLGATLGYRFTGGVGRFGLGESDLNGVVAGGNIGFGWF